ncbi:LPS export ABC transporter periplasmic protein LptC [Candidatus Pelagibacter sp.]|nr:LPS export ABC transporter periplasmic protein LptC [Candidatus Pelagibacter sp.]
MKKKYLIILLIFFLIIIFSLANFNFLKKKISQNKKSNIIEKSELKEENIYSSNKMSDVIYSSKDLKGNEYIIGAKEAEIDASDNNILYLVNVKATIKFNNSRKIEIYSDYGKYNLNNYDTIFSKNVKINYLNNKITSEYLDFSFKRNSMLISKDVKFTDLEKVLKADVIEMNIKTKDTKIYMLENKKKINIKSIK